MSSPESTSYSPLPSNPSSGSNTPLSSSLCATLPIPCYDVNPSDSGRKSHARRQPLGHIPRPCNAFILFRCDFVRQKKIPASVEHDHRNISRIAGKVWQEMSTADKAPWLAMAEREREKHSKAYPNYRYTSAAHSASSSKRKKGKDTVEGRNRSKVPRRRSSSCPPPGATPVLPTPESLPPNMLRMSCTRDDLSRRPSKTIMYQVAKLGSASSETDSPLSSSQEELPHLEDVTFSADFSKDLTYDYARIDPPKGLPGWDAAPPKPYLWNGTLSTLRCLPREPLTGYCPRQNTSNHAHTYSNDWLPITPSSIFTDPFSQPHLNVGHLGGGDSLDVGGHLNGSTPSPTQPISMDSFVADPFQSTYISPHNLEITPCLNYDYDTIRSLLPRLSIEDSSYLARG